MSASVLSGDLKAFPLPEILLMLNNNRKTGSLRCIDGQVTKTVEWENGEIVFARSTRPEDRLGAYLVGRGLITAPQLGQASASLQGQERLGKALIRLGMIAPNVLFEAVRRQVTEIIYSLFHWKEGRFEFEPGQATQEKVALSSTVMNLIMEGTRRLDELSQVKQKIQNDLMVLAPAKTPEELAKMVQLSPFEKTVLDLVDGRRSVREVVRLAGKGEFECMQALYSLLSAGVARVQVVSFGA
jgi:two-component system, OmpR family, response regulator